MPEPRKWFGSPASSGWSATRRKLDPDCPMKCSHPAWRCNANRFCVASSSTSPEAAEPFGHSSALRPKPVYELCAGGAPPHVVEKWVENAKRSWFVRESPERFGRRASKALRIRVLTQRNLFDVPKNLLKREIVWSIRRHRLSMFASWRAPGQEYS